MISLADLDKYKDNLSILNKIDSVGGYAINSFNNKLFYWNFSSKDIKDLVSSFERLLKSRNFKNLENFKNEIIDISNKMIAKEICPIEAILYSSKTINNLLEINNEIIDVIGDIIKDIYFENKEEYKETIKFILKEWTFKNQINILINACGKINDTEILGTIYKFHINSDNKLFALKAFMNSKKCIDYVLSMIKDNNENDIIEVEMSKYFINNFVKSFGDEGIKKAEKYLEDDTISKQSQKIISRALPSVSKVESVTLNTMIKKAKCWKDEEDFEEVFISWMKSSKTRKDAFLAIRYSNHKNVEDMILNTLDNYDCNSVEIGTSLISIAQWGSRVGISENFFRLIEKYKNDIDKKMYCNAAMCSIGKEEEGIKLIEDYLEQEVYNHRQIFSIIRDCSYKSNKLLRKCVKIVYRNYLNSKSEESIIKAINGAYELCNKPKFNFKEIVLFEIKRFINKKNCGENVYLCIINLIDRLLDDKNKNYFVDILFSIIENDFISDEIKSKCVLILKRLKVRPPR